MFKDHIESELAREFTSSVLIIELLLRQAHAEGASDIHIDPHEHTLKVCFRVDGILQEKYTFTKKIYQELICRIKVLSSLRIDEHASTQDGRFRFTTSEKIPIDIRVSIVPTYHGENIVMRLLTDTISSIHLSQLGLQEKDIKKIEQALRKSYGLILTTGPTGSGKTTTLYTCLQQLHTGRKSIITLEDPIEYEITGIRQIQTNPKTGLSFAQGLRAIVRQDPDIIMVGEIRDAETAYTAVNTALTGHMLLSTIHTNDAATAIPRLLDMNVDPYLVASTLEIVIGQRLVRKLCSHCKIASPYSAQERVLFQKYNLQATDAPTYRTKGCEHCFQSGFKGRVGIYEILSASDLIKDLIMQRSPAHIIKHEARKEGMTTMIEDGLTKVQQGLTTCEEVVAALHE